MFRLIREVENNNVGSFELFFNSMTKAMEFASKQATDNEMLSSGRCANLKWEWNSGELTAIDNKNFHFYRISEIITQD